ncbi:hypothetical protein [Confluentibacter citreus]|uniref:hypothetical protein n=1 Tax=Confluentibacter citreus TaxID=2007307 RepID=UPI000C286B30|nr:hypothetical protein [Confluentibacter citreus]
MNKYHLLLTKIDHAKALDFGTIFNQSIDLFKKTWVQGLVALLLSVVLIIPFYIIAYIPLIALGVLSPEFFNGNGDFTEIEGLGVFALIVSGILFLFMIIGVLVITIGLKAAYFRIVKSKDLELNQSDDYFFFLKKRYLKKTITLSFILMGISFLALLLCVLPIFYAMIPMAYMIVIYAFNPELSTSDIVKIGFKLGNKKWLITFVLVIVAWFISSIVGFLMCFIGIYVTQQFINLPFYQVYKECIGFSETHIIDEIGIVQE